MKVKVVTKILEANDRIALENRKLFDAADVFVINLMSAPGAGKTSLLEKTLSAKSGLKIGVIEGDIAGSDDAERIEKFSVPVVQINTGGACHLDANMINEVISDLPLNALDIVFIENVGNLVCPAEFKVGEDMKVMLLSIAEGHDKPLKYPDMFRVADVLLINKIDLLPYVRFDVATCLANARRINPKLAAISVSAERGDGLDDWIAWLLLRRQAWLAPLNSTAAVVS